MRHAAVWRGLLTLALLALGMLTVQAPPASAGVPDARLAAPETPTPPSYKGTWFGTTSQGGEIDFTVNKKNRVIRIEFAYEIAGKDCTTDVDDVVRGPLDITSKRFKVSGTSKLETFTLTGRFTSKTAARGKLVATYTDEQGCSGTVNLTWTAKKGKRPPPPVDPYDGTWMGNVAFPTGLDPGILALAEPTIEFRVENGAVTFMSVPWVIQGPSCWAALTGRILETLDSPVPLAGASFSVAFSISVAGVKDWMVAGAFGSPTAASGSVTMSGTSGPIGFGSCTGSVVAQWTATKQ